MWKPAFKHWKYYAPQWLHWIHRILHNHFTTHTFFLFERDKWAFCVNKKPLSCRHASLSLQLKWSWKSLQKFQVTVAGRKVNWIGGALDICLRNYIMINWTRWHFHFVEAVCRDWLKRVKKEISLEASYEYWSSL